MTDYAERRIKRTLVMEQVRPLQNRITEIKHAIDDLWSGYHRETIGADVGTVFERIAYHGRQKRVERWRIERYGPNGAICRQIKLDGTDGIHVYDFTDEALERQKVKWLFVTPEGSLK